MKLHFHKAGSELMENGAGRKERGRKEASCFHSGHSASSWTYWRFNIHSGTVGVCGVCHINLYFSKDIADVVID